MNTNVMDTCKKLHLFCIVSSLFLVMFYLYNTTEISKMQFIQEEIADIPTNLYWFPWPLNVVRPSSRPEPSSQETVKRIFLDKPLYNTIPLDENGYKTILFHTRNYGGDFILKQFNWTTHDGTFYYPDSVFKCPKKCKGTMDRTLAEKAHGVVFSVLDDMYHTNPGEVRYPKLETRKPEQIWVANTIEAPLYHDAKRLGELGQLFNWTFTYRIDSDVYLPYGYFYKLDTPRSLDEIQLPSDEVLRSKKLAASLISNCGAWSQRDLLLDAIAKHIPVDRYGRCGKPCPADQECRPYLGKLYKFFFAFENSLCQDYITEKFFYAFDLNLVPVTFGLGDYHEVAPPHSYINALDFPNVTALANYLKYLHENDNEYRKYFYWKLNYSHGKQNFATQICALCLKLWDEPRMYTQQVTNFDAWWLHKRKVGHSLNSNVTLGYKLLQKVKRACVSPLDSLYVFPGTIPVSE